MTSDPRVLVLYWFPAHLPLRASVRHHLEAVRSVTSPGRSLALNAFFSIPRWVGRVGFDAVVLHTTLLGLRWCPGYEQYRRRLDWVGELDCPKLAFPQDEYDHCHVLDEWLCDWRVGDVFTNFGDDVRPVLYPQTAGLARFHRVYTGYVDEALAGKLRGALPPLASRPYDIVYRAAHLPLWFGSHGALKHEIAAVVNSRAAARGLRCDISTRPQDTIHHDEWFRFLASARTTVGVESGSSVLDCRGEVQARIRRLLDENPAATLDDLHAHLPAGWDGHRFFALSPRHFEAALCGTAQILVEGEYEGVFRPWEHYLPLRRDFANLDEILERMQDVDSLARMTKQARADICESGRFGYAAFTSTVRSALAQRLQEGTAVEITSAQAQRSRAATAGMLAAKPHLPARMPFGVVRPVVRSWGCIHRLATTPRAKLAAGIGQALRSRFAAGRHWIHSRTSRRWSQLRQRLFQGPKSA
jgi:hypothetical protein